jgi:nucleotide-binding universal stress UspA family protein
VTARWRQRFGIPSRQINLAAEELGADLVTLGAYGSSGLSEVLLGSTAQRVVHAAPCPVLTVHPSPPRRRAPSLVRQVLVPVDFSFCSLDALEYAARLAAQFGAMLTIMHVMEPVLPGREGDARAPILARDQQEQAAARLTDLSHELRSQGLAVETVVGRGIAAEAILAETAAREGDLIVMGTRGRRGLTSLIGGSVAEGVLRQATVPVLTVKCLHVPPDPRLLSAEIWMRVGDQVPVGERTH